jgi:hypothetical protein
MGEYGGCGAGICRANSVRGVEVRPYLEEPSNIMPDLADDGNGHEMPARSVGNRIARGLCLTTITLSTISMAIASTLDVKSVVRTGKHSSGYMFGGIGSALMVGFCAYVYSKYLKQNSQGGTQ